MPERKATTVRRAELADAALALIATRGIAALTTRSLAEAVGLTSGALFRHYATLDELRIGVAERAAELLSATVPDPDLPWRERLDAFVRARLALVHAHPGVPQLVLSDQFSLAVPEPAREALQRSIAETRRFLAGALQDGQRSGELRTDVDADALAALAMGALQMAVLAARTSTGPDRAPLAALLTLASTPEDP